MSPSPPNDGWQHLEDALRLCFQLFCWAFYLCIVAFALSGLHTVLQGKIAQIQRLGSWQNDIEEPGLHFAFPAFIDRVFTFDIQQRRKLECKAFESPLQNSGGGSDKVLITSDGQLIHSRWTLNYRMDEAQKTYVFLGSVDSKLIDSVLEDLLKSTIIRNTASRSIDNLLTHQELYRKSVYDELKIHLKLLDCGLSIEHLSLDNVDVPEPTRDAFNAVQRELLAKDRRRQEAINQARQKEQQLLAQQSQKMGEAKSLAENIRSGLRADAKNLQALVQESDPVLQNAYLQLRLQDVIQQALQKNVDQTYWIQPGGELRLNMGKDPKIEQLRRAKASHKKP